MKLNDLILLEATKVDYVKTAFGDKLLDAAKSLERNKELSLDQIVSGLEQADPTKNKQYLVWIAKQYVEKKFRLEDASRLKNDLAKFDKVKNTLENKDIMKYSLDDLYDTIESVDDSAPVSKGEEERQIKSSGAEKIIDDQNFTVIILKNKEAACYYGKGTKWCTAADRDNMFDQYAKDGNLYMIMVNDNGKQRKFQLHFESGQFMDERDRDVNGNKADIDLLSRFPGYTKFLNMLIDKHYTKVFGDYI
jgi:hypothetical protein